MAPASPLVVATMTWTKAQMRHLVSSIQWVFACTNCGHEETVEEGTMPVSWKFSDPENEEEFEALCDLCSGEGSWLLNIEDLVDDPYSDSNPFISEEPF